MNYSNKNNVLFLANKKCVLKTWWLEKILCTQIFLSPPPSELVILLITYNHWIEVHYKGHTLIEFYQNFIQVSNEFTC